MIQPCHNQDLEASCSTRTIHDPPRPTTINRRDLQGACAQSVGSSILHGREDVAPADTSRRTVPLI